MVGMKTIFGPMSVAVLLSVPAVALAALQPWSDDATVNRAATLAVVDGAQPPAVADAAVDQQVVDLSDWKYTGKSDKSAKSDKSRKSPKSMKSHKSKKSKKSHRGGPPHHGHPPYGHAYGRR